jgi:CheY-like chemotaxis protein/nitrogen-specific signal transduction histidine kinase
MLEFVASQISVAIERKKTEQDLKDALILAHEADRLKSTFLATMSHELRTPLNAVIGFSELIGEDLPMDNVLEFAKIIKNSGEHLLEMIEDIFDITVLESGQLKEKKEQFLLTPLLNEIYEMIASEQQKMGKDDITILFNQLMYDNDLMVFNDPRKLKQVFMNLLKNALKFTHEGFVEFGYRQIPHPTVPLLEFYVKDTGIGIPTESQEIIFEIFRQGDDSHTRIYGGTGIGLSMAKKLTEHLGGKIRVKSKVGEGSTFYFTLPYLETSGDEPVIAEKTIAKPSQNLAGKTILVAEDEDSNYELLEVLLTHEFAKVIRACDGIEALQTCKSDNHIDLILMDLKMPRMTGFEATIEIKKLFPRIPIIAQTAYAMPGDNQKAIEAGCNDYISKPIKKQVLLEKIAKYLSN